MEDLATEQPIDVRQYLAAFGRRRLPMVLTAIACLAVSAVVAMALPPVFRSTATILIEEQEIPQDLVRTTISSYADQRIQVISQQVMTRANLMQVVEKYDLYPRQRQRETSEEVLARMRKDIRLDLVTADVIDRRTGGKTTATIAFTLAYDGETAEKAQKVANELTSLYLNENLQLRQQKVAETSSFLAEEAERLAEHISQIESDLAAFKVKHQGRLPELAALNMQMRERADAELLDTDRALASLEERRFYLEAQLGQIKPNTPIIGVSGERILDPEDRLRTLRAQYAGLEGVYARSHPDMVRMRQQIEALEQEVGAPRDGNEEAKQLLRLRTDLATLRERYADDHPDVVKLKRAIASLETRAAVSPQTEAPARKPENPAYLTLQAQLEGLATEGRALEKRRAELRSRLAELEARLEQTPLVEKDYLDLSRDRENSVARYREIKAKLMEAQVAQVLEKDRKSERFSLIDPPQYPEKPRSPNRPMILLVGAVVALGGGVGCVGVLEALDRSVRGAKDLTRTLPAPLLSVIPHIANGAERRRALSRRRLMLAGAVLALALGLTAIHFLWMPLEVFWYSLLRRLQLG